MLNSTILKKRFYSWVYIFGVGIAMVTTSCSTSPSSQQSSIPQGQVTLQCSSRFYMGKEPMIQRAYLYPPIKVDKEGVPSEELFYTKDLNGNFLWHAPSPESETLYLEIEHRLKQRDFIMVPFNDLLIPRNAHTILILNAYYSDGFSREIEGLDGSEVGHFLFTRLLGVTVGADLDVQKAKTVFDQTTLAYRNPLDSVSSVIKVAFKYEVDSIGRNEEWLKAVLIKEYE